MTELEEQPRRAMVDRAMVERQKEDMLRERATTTGLEPRHQESAMTSDRARATTPRERRPRHQQARGDYQQQHERDNCTNNERQWETTAPIKGNKRLTVYLLYV